MEGSISAVVEVLLDKLPPEEPPDGLLEESPEEPPEIAGIFSSWSYPHTEQVRLLRPAESFVAP